jgi:hypothetical protein
MTSLNATERKVFDDVCQEIEDETGSEWCILACLDANKYGDPKAFGAYLTHLQNKELIEIAAYDNGGHGRNRIHGHQIQLTAKGWEIADPTIFDWMDEDARASQIKYFDSWRI